MSERRGLLARLGLPRTRSTAGAWQEAGADITVDDAAAAARLAQEAATPFGYRRPAAELLAGFGGTGEEERRRATAALALAGVAAEPPLTDAALTQYVQLRRIEATASRRSSAAVPPARPGAVPPPVTSEPSSEPRAGSPASAVRTAPAALRSRIAGMAARSAPSAPVARDRRMAAGALGVAALAAVMIAAVALRGIGDGGGSAANAFPPAAETTARTAPSPAPAGRGGAPGRDSGRRGGVAGTDAPSADGAAPTSRRPTDVRLRIVPSESAYVCVADSAGTLWEGMLTDPYSVRRARLTIRVGVATAQITANGRPVRVTSAPAAFELTPTAIRQLPADQPVCGAATGAPTGDGATASQPDAGG